MFKTKISLIVLVLFTIIAPRHGFANSCPPANPDAVYGATCQAHCTEIQWEDTETAKQASWKGVLKSQTCNFSHGKCKGEIKCECVDVQGNVKKNLNIKCQDANPFTNLFELELENGVNNQ
jgi:hypothetical protein